MRTGESGLIRRGFYLVTAGLAIATAALEPTGGRALVFLLLALQGCGLGLWFWMGSRHARAWTTANAVTGAGWILLFTIPSAIYAVAPGKLAGLDPAAGLGMVDLSLFAMIAGVLFEQRRSVPRAETSRLDIRPVEMNRRRAIGWYVVGLMGLLLLMAKSGGPIAYLKNLQGTAGANAGLFYVIWLTLALRYSPAAVGLGFWCRNQPLSRGTKVATVVGLALLLLTGARLFGVVGASQLLLTYALVRRRPRLARVAPVTIAALALLVFGGGAVKRYQTYKTQHGGSGLGFGTYLTKVAPGETVDAYANNYVDTVRLMAMARSIVPDKASPEGIRPLLTVILKPIPSGLRPALHRDPQIRRTFEPAGPYVYAEPLQVTGYLAGVGVGVVLLFVLTGYLVAKLDRWLVSSRKRSAWTALAAICACVQVPVFLRSGLPGGAAFAGIEVLGTLTVTWHIAGGRLRELISRCRHAARRAASSRRSTDPDADSGAARSRSRTGASRAFPGSIRRSRG
jgi:hypothetical protein